MAFNVVLGGGINLARDVRNGRNFEYFSEDPLVSAVLGAAAVNGTQGEGVISTLKHYSLNCNETNRHWLDAIIDPAAHREADLLAFQIAIWCGDEDCADTKQVDYCSRGETPLSTPEAVLLGDLSRRSIEAVQRSAISHRAVANGEKLTEKEQFGKFWKNSTREEHDCHRI